jgi:hypothetical protein
MQLPVQSFPILQPGQMNPFHQALQTGLANYNQNMQSAYAPLKMQSEIAAKQAYADNYQKQIIATALSNPDAIALYGMDGVKKMAAQLQAMSQSGSVPTPGGKQDGSPGEGAWSAFKSFLTGGDKSSGSGSTGGGATGGYTGSSNTNSYSNTRASADEVSRQANNMPDDIKNYDDNAPQATNVAQPPVNRQQQSYAAVTGNDYDQASQAWANSPEGRADTQKKGYVDTPPRDQLMNWWKNQGQQQAAPAQQMSVGSTDSPSALNVDTDNIDLSDPEMNTYGDLGSKVQNAAYAQKHPSAKLDALREKQKASINAAAGQEAKSYQDMRTAAQKETVSAGDLLNDASKFVNAYNKSTISGRLLKIPGMNYVAGFDPKTIESMNAANKMAIDTAANLFGSKISDYREKLAQSVKLQPDMPPSAVNDIHRNIVSEATRMREHDDALQYMKQKGIKDPNQMANFWIDYNIDRPFIDFQNRIPIKANEGSFKQYIDKRLSTGQRDVNKSATVMHNGSQHVYQNGKWYKVVE